MRSESSIKSITWASSKTSEFVVLDLHIVKATIDSYEGN